MTSIIIVSYNRLDLVKKCLAAAGRNSPRGTEIILVDNNSAEDIVGFIEKEYPQTKVIRNKTNAGFAVGNNQGMRAARGDYFLLLNTDAFLEPGIIETLEKFFRAHPEAGAAAPQLRNSDGTIQPSGGFFPYLWPVFLWMTFLDNLPLIKKFAPAIHVRDRKFFTKIQSCDWLAGACLMVPKKVFEKTGGMDEKMFMYGEELEWCYRIKKAGYKIYLQPAAQITHLGFGSAGPGFGALKEMQSFVYFYKKHQPAWQQPLLKALLILGSLLRILRGCLQPKNRWMINTYGTAIGEILRG
jgi:GT2 family glycosyltransferase